MTIAPSAMHAREQVLVLSSFEAGDPFLEPVIDGVIKALSARNGLELSIEYLDAKRDTSGAHETHFHNMLLAKYVAAPLTAIVVLDKPALDLAIELRAEIAPETPIIFGDVDDFSENDARAIPNITGVLDSHDAEANLALMDRLHPGRNAIVIINDNSERGLWLQGEFAEATDKFADRFAFQSSSDWSIDELEKQLANLGAAHLVIYLSFLQDGEGFPVKYFDGLSRVARSANVPLYGTHENMAGYGIVGGYLQSANGLGRQLGNQVADILDGKDVSDIPLKTKSPHEYVFDFRELQRFNISTRALPSGSKVIEEPDTFYYQYRDYIWIAIAVLLAIVFYIFQLLISIQKRDKARRGLERLVAEGKHPLSVDEPTTLLNEIVDRLKAIAPFLKPVGVYRYASSTGPAVAIEPVPLGIPASQKDQPEPELVKQAAESGQNQFDGNDVLLVLGNERFPADLAHFLADHRLDAFDQRLVDLFTRNISIECDNIGALRLSSSLETAHQIQDSMLPKDFELTARAYDVDVHAMLQPAKQVGGDLYDFFALDDERLCLVVGDVSDKGVPAALFMAMTRTLIRAAAETQSSPDAILAKVNAALCQENHHMMFVTLFCAIYSRGSGEIVYANAGHNPPLVRNINGKTAELAVETNIALGVLPDAGFAAQSMTLPVGATLLLFSDGATEAMNAVGGQFGERRLKEFFASHGAAPAKDFIEALTADIETFAAQTIQSDDLTLLCLRHEQTPASAGPT